MIFILGEMVMVVVFLLMETFKKYETGFLAFYLRHVCLENGSKVV